MNYLRLHAISWVVLAAVCMSLLLLHDVLEAANDRWQWQLVGYPKVFLAYGQLDSAALAFDVCFWAFMLTGSIAAVEIWCRAHTAPSVSLLWLFGILSGICCYFFLRSDIRNGIFMDADGAKWSSWPWVWAVISFDAKMASGYLTPVVFGVAVVGWVKLVALAFKWRA